MQIFSRLKHIIALSIIFIASLPAIAHELPATTIKGKKYYYYTVQPNETIYSIARKLGISKNDIVKYNPFVIDGIRANDTLYFPVAETPESVDISNNTPANSNTITHTVKKGETVYRISKKYGISTDRLITYNPSTKDGIKSGEILVIPVAGQTTSEASTAPVNQSTTIPDNNINVIKVDEIKTTEEFLTEDTIKSNEEAIFEQNYDINIAVMLPFMLDENEPTKQALRYTEFYKGMLLAVNEMRNEFFDIHLYAYDTADSLELTMSILDKPEFQTMNVIVAPGNDAQLNIISKRSKETSTHVINIFGVKNDVYQTNDFVLQTNIPQTEMYSKAINYFCEEFKNHTPVILKNLEKLSDKAEFIKSLKNHLDSINKPYLQISYNDILSQENIASLDSTKSYVFIPASGSRSELSGVINPIIQLKEKTLDNKQIRMFGYPEWTTFRGSILEKMHYLNTVIYSRFYCNQGNADVQQFKSMFNDWYGTELMSASPLQGILGYDITMFILQAAKNNDGKFNPTTQYNGIQSSFNFSSPEEVDGYYNNSLYIITFNQDGTISQTTR